MPKPIVILVIQHDDLKDYSVSQFYPDYFSWFNTELERVAHRKVQITVHPVGTYPSLSGFNYKHADEVKTIREWRRLVEELHIKTVHNRGLEPSLTKILLLTRDNLNSKVAGIANVKGYAAIASITKYRTPAHEIGHMLGATHDDGAIEYDGWWHNSIMFGDGFQDFRGNTYRFTEKNRANIRSYVDSFD
ncbi:hypothetical protein J3P89_27685 [Pseudomonas sp. Z1-14]|uniref:reprolysin-like metallopeptidase n=1 Tax=Pseudomonas sp. Z1-14 TaxID=2817409 RepID=UPI003DA8B25C